MKLEKEFTFKIILFLISFIILLEIVVFVFIYCKSIQIYENTVSDTLERTKQKTTELADTINKYITNLLMNYITKLKLIARYSIFFIGKNKSKPDEVINKNSKIFLNKDLSERIIPAKTEEINKIKHFNKVYNSETNKFDYLGHYLEKFGNENNHSKFMDAIQKEHQELNYISYHSILQPTIINNLDEITKKKLNYMIPLFKSIFLERFESKKSLMDIIRIIILNEKELIIYPPEDYREINLHNFHNMHPQSGCGYIEQLTGNYYSCAYNYIYNILSKGYNLEFIFIEFLQYDILIAAICIKFSFLEGKTKESMVCIEVNFKGVIQSIPLRYKKKYNFGFFNPRIVDLNIPFGETIFHYYVKDLFIISEAATDLYDQLHEVYNSTQTTPYNYVIDNYDPMKILKYYSLYHFIYFDMTKIIKSHPELNINISKIEEEYNIIIDKIFNSLSNIYNPLSIFQINKANCRKELIGNNYECYTDEAEMSIIPLVLKANELNEDYVDTNKVSLVDHILFIYSIVNTNSATNRKDIKMFLYIKLVRIIGFYILSSFLIIILYYIIFELLFSYSFNGINNTFNYILQISLNEGTGNIDLLKESKEWKSNKEMMEINCIYNFIRKAFIIKKFFDNEKFIKKHKIEFLQIIQDIKDKNIKEICNSFLSISHFNDKLYSFAENGFNLTINFLKENEKRLNIKDENEKLKNLIKRSSTTFYINEYSNFKNMDEKIVEIIHLNIYKQRFYYLYGMTKYKLASELDNKKDKKYKEKQEKYFKEAIKYFKETNDINELLGINQIKIIYALIMISKCYINLKDYKNAIFNIEQALTIFFDFSKNFNENRSKRYNPKVMLFVETNIFQYILFTFSILCNSFKKPFASNYIILKIFDTSPFILNNIHYNGSINITNFFEKYKSQINSFIKNLKKKPYLLKEYENIKNHFTKITSRLYLKNIDKIMERKNNNNDKNQTINESITKSKFSSNMKTDLITSKMSSRYYNKYRNIHKNITLCLSEKIFNQINIQEFKDIIINYLKKYFIQNDNDLFSFFQFGSNGKKTILIPPCSLNEFCTKLYKIKNNIENINTSKTNSNLFMGLYDILFSIIQNYQTSKSKDNIIMLFMNSEDIRFSCKADCINIVEELNKNNNSVYFFCFDKIIDNQKINNIQSFLNGLIEGYFFEIKDYQQIKEIFANISDNKKQSSFFKFDYQGFDNYL